MWWYLNGLILKWMPLFAQGILRLHVSPCAICTFNKVPHPNIRRCVAGGGSGGTSFRIISAHAATGTSTEVFTVYTDNGADKKTWMNMLARGKGTKGLRSFSRGDP